MSLVLVDACGANTHSVLAALRRLGVEPVVSADASTIKRAEKVLMPGVGAAGDAMKRLRNHQLDALIPTLTQPVLGICVGMQVLFECSEEDDVDCLGIVPGKLVRIKHDSDHPVPHMGWNQLRVNSHPLFDGLADNPYSYFVHSYALPVIDASIATCQYSMEFTAAVAHANFIGVQFHPERSGDVGARILQNFLKLS